MGGGVRIGMKIGRIIGPRWELTIFERRDDVWHVEMERKSRIVRGVHSNPIDALSLACDCVDWGGSHYPMFSFRKKIANHFAAKTNTPNPHPKGEAE